MGNELDVYSPGGLAPIIETDQPLIESDWGNPYPDQISPSELDGYQPVGSSFSQTWLGQPIDATPRQVQEFIAYASGLYLADMGKLGHPIKHINAALEFFQENITKPPPANVVRQHSYDLHDQAGDGLAEAFGNRMHRVGASQALISNSLYWLGQLATRLNTGTAMPANEQGSSPSSESAQAYEESLTDAQYAQLEKINERAKQQTEIALKNRFGVTYAETMRVVNDYLKSLPLIEQQHFDKYVQGPNGPVHALNDLTVLTRLYEMAIGAGSIENGAGLNTEIQQIELLMRENPKAYFSDSRLQLRLRELYRRRDG